MATKSKPIYTIEYRSIDGHHTLLLDAGTDAEAAHEADELTESHAYEYYEDGDWGDEGYSLQLYWSLMKDDDELDSGGFCLEIEPNHSALIRKAFGFKACCDAAEEEESCGDEPDDHDWTSEGEGGCDENPGVWSTGGTSLTATSHCRNCRLRRTEYITGSQRNPGEHDRIEYELLDSPE